MIVAGNATELGWLAQLSSVSVEMEDGSLQVSVMNATQMKHRDAGSLMYALLKDDPPNIY